MLSFSVCRRLYSLCISENNVLYLSHLTEKINIGLDKLLQWFKANKFSLNVKKPNVLFLSKATNSTNSKCHTTMHSQRRQ